MYIKPRAYTLVKDAELKSKTTFDPQTSRIVWPVCIIAGQIVLLSLALGFVAATRIRGHISLGLGPALFFQDNPQSKNYIFTSLATVISTFSCYLFTQAVRHAIAVSLTRPVPISTLGFGILISRRALIISRSYKWVAVSAVLVVLTLTQTASWTSLLMPTNVSVLVPLKGTEINLSSASFQNQFGQLWDTTLEDYIDSELLSVVDESGAASATSFAGYPALIDYDIWAHISSTHGILPIQLQAFADTTGTNVTQLITVNTEPFPSSTSPITYAMNQQGMTADVRCQTADLDDTTQPPLSRSSLTSGEFTYWNVSTVCSDGGSASSGAWSSSGNTLFLVGCADVDDSGSTTYTVIIDGQQFYVGTYICTIAPQILNAVSNYTGGSMIDTTFDETSTPVDAQAIGYAGVSALMAVFGYGQSELRNSVGDAILAAFDQGYDQAPALLLEAYIRGIIEFTGTAIKTNLALAGGAFDGSPPVDMTRNITGNATVSTVGWQYNTVATGLVVIPIVFVALVCIAITLVAQYYNRGMPLIHADFDPNDPWRLMAAASAGGMTHVFRGVDEEDVEDGLEKNVMLGRVDGRDGFVHIGSDRSIVHRN